MRIIELRNRFDWDTEVIIDFADMPASDNGTIQRITSIYGDYRVQRMSIVQDAASQVAKLKIIATAPPRY